MIINKTPHPVIVISEDGQIVTFEPVAPAIRISSSIKDAGEIAGIRVTKSVFGDAVNMPEQIEGVFYIVSQMVKTAFPERKDLLVPSEVVRDNNGAVIGCKSLGI